MLLTNDKIKQPLKNTSCVRIKGLCCEYGNDSCLQGCLKAHIFLVLTIDHRYSPAEIILFEASKTTIDNKVLLVYLM